MPGAGSNRYTPPMSCSLQAGRDAGQARLLALDTATETVHLSVWNRGEVLTQALPGGAQASTGTLPGIEALLSRAGLVWADLDALAFGRGPGAFTGLRTACSLVQGLALALDKPVIALDTLLAVAESARGRSEALRHALDTLPGTTLWVLQDARMNEIYAAAWRWSAEGWQPTHEPRLWTMDTLNQQLQAVRAGADQGRWHAAGSALTAWPELFVDLPGASARLVSDAVPDGATLAALAARAWTRGDLIDAALALPLYVRDKVAQTTAERRGGV